jgi:hypothetical protein
VLPGVGALDVIPPCDPQLPPLVRVVVEEPNGGTKSVDIPRRDHEAVDSMPNWSATSRRGYDR